MSREIRQVEEKAAIGPALQIAADLSSQVSAAADETDRQRQLTDDLVRSLKAAGVFRLLIPQTFGGLGAQLPDFIDALQRFAEADASTAWCVSQGAVIATTSLWLPADSVHELWQDPATAIANGPPRNCEAQRGKDSLRVTGRWGFSSGCRHATWMHGAVKRVEDNVWLGVYFPKAQAEFHDNWQVAGLRGTGSVEFSVQDLTVPIEWVVDFREPPVDDGALFKIPTGLVFAVCFASVALGVARASLDVALELARGKVPGMTAKTVSNDPDMQKFIGEAEMRWRAARAFLHDTVDTVYPALAQQTTISKSQRVDLRMAGTHVIREAAAVVNLAYTVAGSTAIYQANPLQRRFQDMHVITQHVQARMSHYGYVGRHFLGHAFEPGPLN